MRRSAAWLNGEAQGTRAEFADRIYEWRKTPGSLDSAIAAYKRAVAAVPVGGEEYTRCLGNLATCLSQRFTAAGDPADLDEAIAYGRQAFNSTPVLSSDRPRIMSNLALHLNKRYYLAQDLADLEDCVFFAGAGARETPPWQRKASARRWVSFVQYLYEKYRDTGNEADLNAATDAARRVLAVTRTGDSGRPARLAMLAVCLHARYGLTQSQADLDLSSAVGRLPSPRSGVNGQAG